MIQDNNTTAHTTATRIIIRSNQRTHTRISTQNTRMSQRGSKFGTLTQQQIDLIGRNIHIIALLEWHLARCRTDKRDGISWNQNISIGRLTTTVKHYAIYAVAEDKQRALRWQHIYRYTSHLCNLMAPDTSSVNHNLCTELSLLTTTTIQSLNSYDTLLLAHKFGNLVICQHLCAVRLGINKVSRRKTEWIDSAIWNSHSSNHIGVSRRLQQ